MMQRLALVSAVFLCAVAAAPRSLALSQSKHRSISESICWKHKLPSDFCAEVGAGAYNVDHYEWDTLAAHAQPEDGQSKCEAANAVLARIRALAIQMRVEGQAKSWDSTDLARTLGRTLHTLQDNCAHSGMPNVEHAWFSLSDSCLDTKLSPDVRSDAVPCAEHETVLAFDAFATALELDILKVDGRSDPEQQQPSMFFPPRGGVCDFLKSAATWDGVDHTWNNDLVVPALRDELYVSLVVGAGPELTDICAGGSDALEPVEPVPAVSAAKPIAWCTSLNIYCVGKTDGADTAPPWESAAPSEPEPAAATTASDSGCSASGTGENPSGSALVALTALAALRRRRGRRGSP